MANTITYDRDPKAVRISVYYTESSTVYQGMPVCYEFDATTNWLGTSDFETESSTTAEGSHNEGKFIRVEDPDADNIHAFAGVVAEGSSLIGETGPGLIDIYIPNGAIVLVRTDQNCTVGRTILAVHTAEQHLTAPHSSASHAVAIACETVDKGTTTGLTLAKLDDRMFIWQEGDATTLLVDDKDASSNMIANKINVEFITTSGNSTALWVEGTSSAGAVANGYGLALYAQANVTGTVASHVAGSGIWLNVTGGTPAEYLTALEVGLYENGATMTSAGRVSVLTLSAQVEDDVTANNYGWIWLAQNGTQVPDALILGSTAASLPAVAFTGDHAFTTADYGIKVYLANNPGTQQYYIPLIAALS